jgi:hypothetical protein
MKKAISGLVFLAFVLLLPSSAFAQAWEVYKADKSGFAMLVPKGAKGVDFEKSGWKGMAWDFGGAKIIGISKLGNYKNDLIRKAAAELSGIPGNLWQKVDAGKGANGWKWWETYMATDGKGMVFCVIGEGPSAFYILYVITTSADYQQNKAAYDTWYKSLTVYKAK